MPVTVNGFVQNLVNGYVYFLEDCSNNGHTFRKGTRLYVGLVDRTPEVPTVATRDDDGVEYTLFSEELGDLISDLKVDLFPCAAKLSVNVGDTVMILQDARMWSGVVIKENKKTFKVSYQGSMGRTEVRNMPKDRVANHKDFCTVVCDYKKDPNGMSVRFEYGDDFVREHRGVRRWGHNSAGFYSLN